ncbi:hypothetical protein ACOSQ3_011727 [Xanthoceras sorbifolium]
MKKLSCFACYVLPFLLLFTSSVEMMRQQVMETITIVEEGGRCLVVMDPDGCNLLSCKQRCLQMKNGNGVCLSKLKKGYQCVCYINC